MPDGLIGFIIGFLLSPIICTPLIIILIFGARTEGENHAPKD